MQEIVDRVHEGHLTAVVALIGRQGAYLYQASMPCAHQQASVLTIQGKSMLYSSGFEGFP